MTNQNKGKIHVDDGRTPKKSSHTNYLGTSADKADVKCNCRFEEEETEDRNGIIMVVAMVAVHVFFVNDP
jgi:hypothetical protein